MEKKDYIRYIISMLKKIDDDKLIKDIYMFVQSCFLSSKS